MSDAKEGAGPPAGLPAAPAVPPRGGLDEPPPFWSRWGRIYGFIAALLAAETLAFWLLSRWAS